MKHVLCFGDSNTWGFIPGTCKRYDEHTRWTGVLQDELGADWRIHENGQNGRTTVFPEPGKNFMTGVVICRHALRNALMPVVTMVGMNFGVLLGGTVTMEAVFTLNGVGTLIRTIQTFDQLYPASVPLFGDNKPRILVLTPIEIGENVAEWDTLYGKGQESRKFPALMKGLCEWLGVEMMNTQEIVQPSKVDGIHMMPEEHRKLALAVRDRLLGLVKA